VRYPRVLGCLVVVIALAFGASHLLRRSTPAGVSRSTVVDDERAAGSALTTVETRPATTGTRGTPRATASTAPASTAPRRTPSAG